jgi:hypothetical protein
VAFITENLSEAVRSGGIKKRAQHYGLIAVPAGNRRNAMIGFPVEKSATCAGTASRLSSGCKTASGAI